MPVYVNLYTVSSAVVVVAVLVVAVVVTTHSRASPPHSPSAPHTWIASPFPPSAADVPSLHRKIRTAPNIRTIRARAKWSDNNSSIKHINADPLRCSVRGRRMRRGRKEGFQVSTTVMNRVGRGLY